MPANNFVISDSFDNISLFEKLLDSDPNRTATKLPRSSGEISADLPSDDSQSQNDASVSNCKGNEKEVTFDDTTFLTESLSQHINLNSTSKDEKVFDSDDIFGNSQDEIFANAPDFSQVVVTVKYENSKEDCNKSSTENAKKTNFLTANKKLSQCLALEKSVIRKDSIILPCSSKKINADSKNMDLHNLKEWNLPENILLKYRDKNIVKMFDWQVQCLSNKNIIESNRNLVYSAPTSAGKTLVAEILAIKTVLERKKKVIFILPFVSVVREKMFYLQDIFCTSGVRVEGFMGSYTPPGGFHNVHVAICTIEKANNIVNRLLEENRISDIGTVIVDEMHLIGDASRGYLLELLLTKLLYMSKKNEENNIQIIGMSATLPNLDVLAKWLDAELYTTQFRPIPLHEHIKLENNIFNSKMELIRTLELLPELDTDTDNILQLCIETITNSCSVLIFCPTKNWCENLSQQISTAFARLITSDISTGKALHQQLNTDACAELLEQLKRCPVGLDKILDITVRYGVSFHHAGLTMDEREIIEEAFRNGTLRVLVATSTLSSGVNLPAQRVIIRTPIFHGKCIDSLTYQQMIGRAGRMGKDTSGESILICQKNNQLAVNRLLASNLDPIESCLEISGRLNRAVLEVIASGVVSSQEELTLFGRCTLLSHTQADENELSNPILEVVNFLQNNEFIRLQSLEDISCRYVPTSLGKACLSSSLPPEEGLSLFSELQKARQCFVLESELHIIYLVTPYSAASQWNNIDWFEYLNMYERLPSCMKRVGELVGVRQSYLVSATRSRINCNTSAAYQKLMVHKRFYTALALQDLVNEIPLHIVASKYNCSRGLLQSLQQSASTFAGIVTTFSHKLGWSSIEILVSQFQNRLQFGVNRDLLDLMRLPLLTGQRARALHNAGIETLVDLASCDIYSLENILQKCLPFESEKKREGETDYGVQERKKFRSVWITGKSGLTEREAAGLLIKEAQRYLQLEMGLANAQWAVDVNNTSHSNNNNISSSGCSSDTSQVTENGTATCDNHSDSESDASEVSFTLLLSPSPDAYEGEKGEVTEVLTHHLAESTSDDSLFEENGISLLAKVGGAVSNINNDIQRKRKTTDVSIGYSQSPLKSSTVLTPSKKRKMNTHQRNSSLNLDNNSDITDLEIIDVCTNKELFETFYEEVKNVTVLSLSMACSEITPKTVNIGSKLFKAENVFSPTQRLTFKNTKLDGIAINWGGNTAYFVNFWETQEVPYEMMLELFNDLLSNPLKTIRLFDSKEQLKIIYLCCGLTESCFVEDPKIADWLLEPEGKEKNLQAMAVKYCTTVTELSQLAGNCKGLGAVGLNVSSTISSRMRASVECVVSWYLVDSVRGALFHQDLRLLDIYDTEMQSVQCLAKMEVDGIGVDKCVMLNLVKTVKEQMAMLEKQVYSLAGRRFTLTSSTEVAKAIGIYRGRRVSTSKKVLQKSENPVSNILLQWRKLSSTLNKMLYPLIQIVDNTRIYSCCITHSATGRITMHEPNLQNIPRNFTVDNPVTKVSVEISCRSAFVCDKNWVLLSADYCQLELRLLAHFSKDKLLCAVLKSENDVFKTIAAKWNNIPEQEVNDMLRQRAKQICYGIIYGMGTRTLSQQLMVTEEEAMDFVESFHSKYPGIRNFTKEVIEKCRRDEFVETINGRRRYIPNINSASAAIKNQSERQAVNTTIQGSAADIAKKAMVNIASHFRETFAQSPLKPKMVLHLHDELLYEIPQEYLKSAARIVQQCMEGCMNLSIPLKVKLRCGPSWGGMKEIVI